MLASHSSPATRVFRNVLEAMVRRAVALAGLTLRVIARRAEISESQLSNAVRGVRLVEPVRAAALATAAGEDAAGVRAMALRARAAARDEPCPEVPEERRAPGRPDRPLSGLVPAFLTEDLPLGALGPLILGALRAHPQAPRAPERLICPALTHQAAAREVATGPGAALDVGWAASALGVRPGTVRAALADLAQAGLLRRQGEIWAPAQPIVSSGQDAHELEVALLHDAFLQAAQVALPGDAGAWHQTVALVPLDGMPQLLDAVHLLRHRLDAAGDALQRAQDPECDQLVTWNLQLLPLSAPFGGDLPLPAEDLEDVEEVAS